MTASILPRTPVQLIHDEVCARGAISLLQLTKIKALSGDVCMELAPNCFAACGLSKDAVNALKGLTEGDHPLIAAVQIPMPPSEFGPGTMFADSIKPYDTPHFFMMALCSMDRIKEFGLARLAQ